MTKKPEPLTHEAISASAGSGKTFQLAHRYLRLLALGVAPDRIIALTFSRKAAGEIFEAVVEHLCRAASSPRTAAGTAERLKMSLGAKDFTALLRGFLDQLHRVHIGTLDSFIVGVVRAFPTELGIAAGFQVMDTAGPEADDLRRQVFGRVFDPRRSDPREQREFLEAFKQATFGKEEKTLGALLDRFVVENRERYQILPAKEAWEGSRVWPANAPWRDPPHGVEAAATALLRHLEAAGNLGKPLERWRTFLEGVAAFSPGAALPKQLEYLLPKLLEALGDLRRGKAALALDRKECPLEAEGCRLVLQILHHLMGRELDACVEKTRGLYHVLNHFEQLYDAQMRRSGRMTFSDAQYLLTEANPYSGGALLSRSPDTEGRLYIDYRLDCRLDHWLLDEFQDTSDLQWAAFRNLVDEIVQSPAGDRSFFYVGDVKQAIYSWRGGNPRLFHQILQAYPGQIVERRLATSFRSCDEVIGAVNQVFGRLPSEDLPAGAVERWQAIWQEHCCEPGNSPGAGYVALLEPARGDARGKPDAEARYRAVAGLLNELRPLEKGLSVAVLVRSNKTGRQIVDLLRRECVGMTIAHEGSAPILDNPVVAVLLSLVKLAAHPGDTFAWRHVQMSPLRAALQAAGIDRATIAIGLLRRMHAAGMASFVRYWGGALDRVSPLDPFGRQRWSDLVEAAAAFDGTGRRDADAFLRFMDGYSTASGAARRAIRVMTIHQSKGLGFDVVILPELMDKSLATADVPGVLLKRDDKTQQPAWALSMPRRMFAEADPVLAGELRRRDEDACFDELCVLYVAITRAKRGLYMVTSYPGDSARAYTPAALLKGQLCGDPKAQNGKALRLGDAECTCLWERGDAAWFRALSSPGSVAGEPAAALDLPAGFAAQTSQRVRLSRVEPSAEEESVTQGAWLFNAESRDVLDFGTAIHELFKQVGWIEETDVEAVIREWSARAGAAPEVKRDAADQFRRAMAADEVRRALARPAGQSDIWRERPFEIVLEGNQWVTGAFDRVVVMREAGGAPARAVIIDYKSNRISRPAEFEKAVRTYRPQLALYRRALAFILGLDESRIGLRILFTRAGRVFDV